MLSLSMLKIVGTTAHKKRWKERRQYQNLRLRTLATDARNKSALSNVASLIPFGSFANIVTRLGFSLFDQVSSILFLMM